MKFIQHTFLVAVLATGAAFAQTVQTAALTSSTTSATNDALYQQLGGQPGLVELVDDFVARLITDPRLNPFFKDADQDKLKTQLIAQFCEVSGGPCKLKGKDMKTVHSGQDITKSNFNAMVEVLQLSMDAQAIPFATQNKLLARLAPMHREIVNSP